MKITPQRQLTTVYIIEKDPNNSQHENPKAAGKSKNLKYDCRNIK
jgi:hypothetical protein